MPTSKSTYTFRTVQRGASGAVVDIFRDLVHVHSTALFQAFGEGNSDRHLAARAAREWIGDQKVLDSFSSQAKSHLYSDLSGNGYCFVCGLPEQHQEAAHAGRLDRSY